MQITNLLEYSNRLQLRQWLTENHQTARECWVTTSRSKTPREDAVPYVDAVEEALCFGWIDSTCKRLPDGRLAQRLSPRRKGSHWTERNIDRCHRLMSAGLMTEAGIQAMPKFAPSNLCGEAIIAESYGDKQFLRFTMDNQTGHVSVKGELASRYNSHIQYVSIENEFDQSSLMG
ncbi:MAG: hypothetical protein IJK22_02195 [Bacteroidales bacterium]|nr:hypothetical protein [Bacteroidales bacterium]